MNTKEILECMAATGCYPNRADSVRDPEEIAKTIRRNYLCSRHVAVEVAGIVKKRRLFSEGAPILG